MPTLSNARAEPDEKEAGCLAELAVALRTAQLFAHAAHNVVRGPSFFSDHAFLGDAYAAYERAYDDVIERAIGTGESVSLAEVTEAACEALERYGTPDGDAEDIFRNLLVLEGELCSAIDSAMKGASNGTQDLLQALCSAAEIRRYMLRQRLAD